MPGIFYEPMDRRLFLRATALAGFALTVAGSRAADSATAGGEFHIALLSDIHVPGDKMNGHRGFNPWENLKRTVPEVSATNPEVMLVCGDAARLEGLPEDYQEVKALLEPLAAKVPIYIGMGNHDDRANFKKVFPNPTGIGGQVADKHVLVIEAGPVRMILLDSLLYVNKVPGLLGKKQRQWLADYLGAHKEKPTIVFVHHTLKDDDGDLLDAERMFEIVESQEHVKAIFFGHSHVWNITKRKHLHLVNLPAVGYNFRDQDPIGWVDAHFDAKGVELALHAFAGNRVEDGKVTRLDWF